MLAARKPSLPPVTNEAMALIASWFRTLAEPSRLKILRALEDAVELTISGLAEANSLSQANVSRHVQSLVDAGMVVRHRVGLTAVCYISDPGVTELCETVCSNLVRRLSSQAKNLTGR